MSNLCIDSTAINGAIGAAGTHPCTDAELNAGKNIAHAPAASAPPPPPPPVAQSQRPVEQSFASRIFAGASASWDRVGMELREVSGSIGDRLDALGRGASNLWEIGNGE